MKCLTLSLPLCVAIIFMTALLPSVQPLQADDVEEQLANALEQYRAKHYAQVSDLLRWCLNRIEDRQRDLLVSFLPEKFEHYVAQKASVTSLPGGGQMASRDYHHPSQTRLLTLEMSLDSPLIESMADLFVDPKRAGNESESLTVRNYKAVAEYKKGEQKGAITLLIRQRLLIIARGTNVDDLTEVEALLSILELERMEQTFFAQ